MCKRSVLLLLFWILVPATTFATPVLITAKERGQGFAFLGNGKCQILVPLHVLGIDPKASPPNSVDVKATVNNSLVRTIAPPDRRAWVFADLDIGLLLASDLALCEVEERRAPPSSSPQILYRNASGTIEYLPVKILGQSGAEVLIGDATGGCSLLQGRSGSIVLGESNRVLGMLKATPDCRTGHVVDFDRVNSALSKVEDGLRVPLHPLSYDLMKAAREANETAFNSLLKQIGDPETRDGSGRSALKVVAGTSNNFYDFRQAAGLDRPRPGEAYEDFVRRTCSIWIETRLRMARTLLTQGAQVDGDGASSWTPLMNAVSYDNCDNIAMVRLLLDKGAAPNHVYRSDATGKPSFYTPLMVAVDWGLPNTIDALLRKGADPNIRADGLGGAENATPLMAIALDSEPSDTKGFPDSSSSCWDTDNVKVAKFRLLAKVSDLGLRIQTSNPRTNEFNNLTVENVLRRRLGGGCNNPTCDGKGRTGPGRCWERMLGALH